MPPRRENTTAIDRPARTAEPTPTRRPAPPPPAPPATDSGTDATVAAHAARVAAAERLIEREAAGKPLSPDDDLFVLSVYTKLERSELLRILARRVKMRRTAGTAAEREAAEARHQEAAERLRTEGAEKRAKAEQLAREVAALERAEAEAAADVERRTEAVATLRTDPTLLSHAQRARYEYARARWERDFGRPSREARAQARGLLAAAGLNPDTDKEQIAQHCDVPKLRAIVRVQVPDVDTRFIKNDHPSGNRDQRRITVNRAAWAAHVAELRQQAEEAEAEAGRLEREGEQARRELDDMLLAMVPA